MLFTALPPVADLPEFEDQSALDTPALPEDNNTTLTGAPDETPRKRQKLDRSAKDSTLKAPDTPAAADSAEEIDSGDEMGPPTLADQVSLVLFTEPILKFYCSSNSYRKRMYM